MSARRPHHYRFAHRFMPAIAHRLGADLVRDAADGVLTDALVANWRAFGEEFDEADRLEPTGLTGTHHLVGGHEVALITYPPALYPPEAYFAAVTAAPRYLVLEYGVDPMSGDAYTVMCEWTRGSHLNCGPGPAPTAEAFLTAIAPMLDAGGPPA
jgi:hypothetical protein